MPTKITLPKNADVVIYQKKDSIKVNPFKIIIKNEGSEEVFLNFLKVSPRSTAIWVFDGETIHAKSAKGTKISFDFDFS
jgi:hypothetical protein